MKKALFLILAILSFSQATEPKKCDKCSISKEFMRCSYYVLQKADLTYQNSCLVYAKEMQKAGNNGSASWFYIVAGEFDKAIKSGKKSVEVGEKYALEHIAEAYYLKGESEQSKEFFKLLKQNIHDKLMMEKHFQILQKLYPEKSKGIDKLY
jgi:tetratricopeptide (TPR) repeat protein